LELDVRIPIVQAMCCLDADIKRASFEAKGFLFLIKEDRFPNIKPTGKLLNIQVKRGNAFKANKRD